MVVSELFGRVAEGASTGLVSTSITTVGSGVNHSEMCQVSYASVSGGWSGRCVELGEVPTVVGVVVSVRGNRVDVLTVTPSTNSDTRALTLEDDGGWEDNVGARVVRNAHDQTSEKWDTRCGRGATGGRGVDRSKIW